MPEGVEVRLLAEGIAEHIVNIELTSIKVLSGRYRKKPITGLRQLKLPAVIKSVGVRGKLMWWQLKDVNGTNEPTYLLFTLGMAGGWTLRQTDYNRVEFIFGKFSLYLMDVRNFATVRIVDGGVFESKLKKLGPDMFSRQWTSGDFYKDLSSVHSIAAALLSQKIVAGPGAYIIAEALYRAKIAPSKIASKLTKNDAARLYDAIRKVAAASYRANKKVININTLSDDIKNINKFRFLIYDKVEDPFGNPVRSFAVGERSIKWVPAVQRT